MGSRLTYLTLLEIYSGVTVPKIIEIGGHSTRLLQKSKKDISFLIHSVVFPHKRNGNFPTGTPLAEVSNARVCKNRDFRPISRFILETIQHTGKEGKGLNTCYSATYMSQTRDQQRSTISKVAADWHEPMVPQRIMWPSIARANGQFDPRCS